MTEYYIPTKRSEARLVEKRSEFIGRVWRVESEEEARMCIEATRKKDHAANHHCWCYVIQDGPVRYSDDGEPAGTAGIPTLDVIQKEGITDICVVVTRYFGGTLLGAGGLVRAYTKGAKVAIDAAQILEKYYCFEYTVNIDYTMLSKIQSEALAMGCIPGETEYANDVTLTYYVPYDLEGFEEKLIDVSNGRAIIKKCGNGKYVDVI